MRLIPEIDTDRLTPFEADVVAAIKSIHGAYTLTRDAIVSKLRQSWAYDDYQLPALRGAVMQALLRIDQKCVGWTVNVEQEADGDYAIYLFPENPRQTGTEIDRLPDWPEEAQPESRIGIQFPAMPVARVTGDDEEILGHIVSVGCGELMFAPEVVSEDSILSAEDLRAITELIEYLQGGFTV